LATGFPLFKSSDEFELLHLQFNILGMPSEDLIMHLEDNASAALHDVIKGSKSLMCNVKDRLLEMKNTLQACYGFDGVE